MNSLPTIVSYENVLALLFIIVENIILICFENKKIVITKDESENKIYIQLVNYFFINKKDIVINLNNISFNVIYSNKKYILLIFNNCSNRNEIDASNNKNTLLQFFFFGNIDVNKFNDQNNLSNILNQFSRNQENLNFNINSYMNNQQGNLNQFSFTKYIIINEHIFAYYNKDPWKNNNYILCLFKGVLITLQSVLLIGVIPILIVFKQYSDGYMFFFTIMTLFFLIIIFLIGSCICDCRKSDRLRIDIIYSFNFDKIFIGTSYNDANKYCTTFELFINEIDRFILKKNKINDKGIYLYVIFKGNTDRKICFIEDQQEELEGLLYILNKKVVDSNNIIEQQSLNKCTPPLATSGY